MEISKEASMKSMTFDKIGLFKGKAISTMTREELLEFVVWCSNEIWRLTKIERETQDVRLKKEVKGGWFQF